MFYSADDLRRSQAADLRENLPKKPLLAGKIFSVHFLDNQPVALSLLAMKLSPITALVFLIPLLFASCRSSRTKSGSGVSDAGTPGHNMSRKDYPFDENGNYHEEWARGDDSGKVVDLTKDNPPSAFLGTTDPRDEKPPTSKTTASSKSKPKSGSSSKPKSKVASKPKSKPKATSTTVTVKKGDTLYGLALRYKTSVKSIQTANGMGSSTTLRDGRSLKIPR